MTWIGVLQLVISCGRALASKLAPKADSVYSEIADEMNAGLDKLQSVHDKVVTLQGLEDLRTTTQW